jgi:transposase
MSKARLVITAVVIEGRRQSGVARAYQVSQPWISRLVARYHAEVEAAFQPCSRRAHTIPKNDPEALRRVLSDNGPGAQAA